MCLTEFIIRDRLSRSVSLWFWREATDLQKVAVKGTGRDVQRAFLKMAFHYLIWIRLSQRDLPLKKHMIWKGMATLPILSHCHVTRALTDVQIQIIWFSLGISLKLIGIVKIILSNWFPRTLAIIHSISIYRRKIMRNSDIPFHMMKSNIQ